MSELPRHVVDTAPPLDVEAGVAAVMARGLRVATTRGVVIPALEIDLVPGSVGAVVGGSRTGKSTLLLALTGRLRHVSGMLLVEGHDGIHHPGQVRRLTAVARLDTLIAPESSLSLEDCLTERTLLDAGSPRARLANYLHAAHLVGLDAPLDTLYGKLAPADQTRAALALACVRPSALVVIDDLDRGATLDEQKALWAGVQALAADGTTVVASTTERLALPVGCTLIDLDRN